MTNNKGKKVLNVPALRFPEFTEGWNYESLDTIAPNITSGRSKPSLGEYNLYGSTGIIGKTATADYSGDMLLVARVGANAGSLQLVNDSCGITDNTLIIKPCKLSSHYLYFYLQHYNLNRLVFGSGQPLITAGMLKKVRIPFGNQLEQKKIENFLCCIDERITTQNKIIEKLETLIKGIVDVIFTSNKFPKVPFKEVYLQAGEGGTPATSIFEYYDNGDIPFIKIDDLKNKYIESNKDYITEFGLQKSSAWIVPSNSIIYSNGATIGAISINKYPVCTKQGILGIVPKANINVEFLYYFMTSTVFTKEVERIVTEGTMRTAYLKDINHIPCPVPCPIKQTEIARLLSTLSAKLENEVTLQRKLHKQKEFFLSQMFI